MFGSITCVGCPFLLALVAWPQATSPSCPAWTAEGDQADCHYGESVSSAGDVNGDGYDDVIVGAYAFNNDLTNEGRAWTHLGSATGLSAIPAWTAEGDVAGAYFGGSVSTAGDVNGDGYGDVIVGLPSFANGELYEGAAYVYLGSSPPLRSEGV